jgi:3-oxoadipate enol-lactonase
MSISWSDSDPGGRRDPVVFLHAFPLNCAMWEEQVLDLSKSHRTITLDWPGFGKSPISALPANGEGVGSLDGYALCVLDLFNRLGIDRAHVCGLSMGGYVALSLLRLAPQRIRSLILCDTRATADTPEARQARYEMVSMIRQSGEEGIERLASAMIERLLGDSTLTSNRELVSRVLNLMRQSSPVGVERALEAMAGRPDSTNLLPQVGGSSGIDTLIIVGNEDKLTPPSEMKTLAGLIPNSSISVIEKAGHLPNLEQAEVFNRIIREFLP